LLKVPDLFFQVLTLYGFGSEFAEDTGMGFGGGLGTVAGD